MGALIPVGTLVFLAFVFARMYNRLVRAQPL